MMFTDTRYNQLNVPGYKYKRKPSDQKIIKKPADTCRLQFITQSNNNLKKAL